MGRNIRRRYQKRLEERFPLKVGERVEVTARGTEIVIRPIVEIPRDQAWVWSKEWHEQAAQSIKDL